MRASVRSRVIQGFELMGGIVRIIAGEWMLSFRPNGGTVILLRTVWITVVLFVAYIGLKHSLDASRTWQISWNEFCAEAQHSLTALGAILAAVYASLYSRFASQWGYLAGLYNQLIAAEVNCKGELEGEQLLRYKQWIAGFIEDAVDLHLATKPIFTPAILEWLNDEDVRDAFIDGAENGNGRLEELKARLEESRSLQRGRHRKGPVLGSSDELKAPQSGLSTHTA